MPATGETWRFRAAGLVASLGLLSLVTNRLPWVTVVCYAAVAVLAVRRPDAIAWGLGCVWGYWILSLAISGFSVALLLDPEFHRRDGQIFFSLLPILVFSWVRLSSRHLGMLLAAVVACEALVALAASGAAAMGRRELLHGSLFQPDEYPNSNLFNYVGLYQAHNAVGSVQALCCLIATAMATFTESRRARLLWGGSAVLLLWGVVLSKSRGSWLGLAVGLAALGWMAWRARRLRGRHWLLIGAVLAIHAVVLFPTIKPRLQALLVEGGTHTWRWEKWTRAVEEWSWSPVVGSGLGRYNDEERVWSGIKRVAYVVTSAKTINRADHAHQSYLHLLAEGGLVGLGVTLAFWIWVAWRLRKAREPLRRVAFLSIVYLFAISLTEHYMGGGAMMLLLATLVGAAWHLPDAEDPDTMVLK